jgi:hypothetical protein
LIKTEAVVVHDDIEEFNRLVGRGGFEPP